MRKLYLHIGCGKTGSSALQHWLNNNAQALKKSGVYYPLFGAGKLDDYAITSGNGAHLMRAIAAGSIQEFLHGIAEESDGDILLSTEQFQSLNTEDLLRLRDVLPDIGLDPVIIAYVRDVYDMMYSSYLQLVKRHLYTQSFKEFALSSSGLQQFGVMRKWGKVFNGIRVLHYDTEKNSLGDSFCAALGIDKQMIPNMPTMKVNRSLTLEEAELLRHINKSYTDCFKNPDQRLSSAISDAMIMSDPEVPTPILLVDEVVDYVDRTFKADIEWMNSQFFEGRDVLSSFKPNGKYVARDIPVIGKSVITAIQALMVSVESFEFSKGRLLRRDGGGTERFDIADPRIVDVLRDEAMKREEVSLADALSLMSAARTLRPAGPLINRKIEEYKAKLGVVEA